MSEPLDLEAIKGRYEAATAGPWIVTERDDWLSPDYGPVIVGDYIGPLWGCSNNDNTAVVMAPAADVEFVIAARSDVPALVAEVERLRRELRDTATDLLRLNRLCTEARKEREAT